MRSKTTGFAAGLLAGLLLVAVTAGSAAAVPRLLNAQGVVRDSGGTPAEGLLSVAFTLYDRQSAGTVLWTEVQEVPVTGGVFGVLLGADAGNLLPLDLFSERTDVWLGVQVEAEAELPRQRLVTVPYAFEADHAVEADVAFQLDCVGCIGNEQLTIAPASQADLASLTTRVRTLETSLAALTPPTLGQMRCAANEILVYSGGAWTCSGDYVTSAELDGARVTSVDGLAGGTIGSNVTVTGAVTAIGFTQNGHAVCDESGNCGQSLADIVCADGQTLSYDGAAWACADLPQAPTPPVCSGANQALQYDGTDWKCVTVKTYGPSAGKANAYEIIDDWGYAWDGLERGATTWALAQAVCTGLGGRLPTVTELYRNNASRGTGNVGTPNETRYYWTLISNYQANRVTVRLSDGAISNSAESAALNYKCVWPDHTTASFEGDYCYGPPGTECVNTRRWYNIDRYDRPALDMVAASHECNFYNASIPSLQDWTDAIHTTNLGTTGAGYLWSGDLMYYSGAPYVLHAIVRFSEAIAPNWAFDNAQNGGMGNWNWATAVQNFRCIGKRNAAEGVDPTSPACNGGCFAIVPNNTQGPDHGGRRAPIWADSADRTAANRATAATTCEGLGASLPTLIEAQELIHTGWTAGTNNYLWSSSPVYHGNYQNFTYRWSGAGPKSWYTHHANTISWNRGDGSLAYRCVWHQTFQATPVTCEAGRVPQWSGTGFTCLTLQNGNDNGGATDGGWTDDWGNEWDRIERAAAAYDAAAAACQGLGARLATPSELHRLRQGGPNPIPNGGTSYLWTNIPSYRQGYQTLIRLSDGGITDGATAAGSTTRAFRCVWPATHGNVFGGRACTGSAATGLCFSARRYTTDAQDRAPIYAAAAAHECAFFGGYLTNLRGFETLVHAGLPNGQSSLWTWLMDPMYSGAYYLALTKWSGVGTSGWYWNSEVTSTATLAAASGGYVFRCVFDDYLR